MWAQVKQFLKLTWDSAWQPDVKCLYQSTDLSADLALIFSMVHRIAIYLCNIISWLKRIILNPPVSWRCPVLATTYCKLPRVWPSQLPLARLIIVTPEVLLSLQPWELYIVDEAHGAALVWSACHLIGKWSTVDEGDDGINFRIYLFFVLDTVAIVFLTWNHSTFVTASPCDSKWGEMAWSFSALGFW